MSLREWLIAIGTLVILGIIIDGIRRMRRARKDAMAISSGMGADDLEDGPLEDEYNPELPNGGARPVNASGRPERKAGRSRFANPEPKPTRPIISTRTAGRDEPTAPAPKPERPVQPEPEHRPFEPEQAPDSVWSALDDEPLDDDGILGAARPVAPERRQPEPETSSKAAKPERPEPRARQPEQAPPVVTSEVEEDTARREPAANARRQPPAGANRPPAQEVIVINVLARPDKAFNGAALKKLFEACGLELGDMDIYHRHEEADTTSPVQFSVANAVEPGTFREDDMASLSTPGISFFMSMPGPGHPLQAFDFMLETAQCVVRNLGGELKDERRSVMTPQTIEHCRQRVREFERKRRSQRV
ncbi:MAG: cell division protein ZipA [Marinobacter sp.]|uniref:cell division protein ZipA n=1 Tax=Marinobacter sp. TaxID=50741 RepID=UPI00299D89EE|nr:cell division protein ZipA [Marinobacter sp.]MDX1634274.1 cell division protein ZipA [Marinobacter sp.]